MSRRKKREEQNDKPAVHNQLNRLQDPARQNDDIILRESEKLGILHGINQKGKTFF